MLGAAIAAVVDGDVSALRAQLVFERLPCSNRREEGFIGPLCGDGSPEGTELSALLVVGCSGSLLRADSVDEEVAAIAAGGYALNAVFLAPTDYFPSGERVVVFSLGSADDADFRPEALALVASDRGVTAIRTWCNNRLIPVDADLRFEFGPQHREP